MSLFALSWAFGLQLPPNEKIVLLALADCENDETLRCDPGQAHLAQKSSLGERTVREMLKALEARELIARERRGSREGGRQTDNYRLACRGLAADSAGKVSGKSEGGNRHTVAVIENRKEPELNLDPVPEVTTEGPVDNSATVSAGRDGQEASPSPKSLRRLRGRGISTPDVFASVGQWLTGTNIDDEGLERLAAEIIRKAGARVINPTAYVVEALRNPDTRFEWVARAYVIAADVYLERATRDGRAV